MRRLTRLISCFFALPLVLMLAGIGTSVAAKEVTIGYQLIYNPWKVAIADGRFEKETGYKIDWRKFDSGAKVITAMASGDVHIALAGSSPIAAGVSQGIDVELFWIVEDIAAAEALVVRNGSGILAPQDLKGKKIGVPFVSTTHFHMLFALEQFGIKPNQVQLLNMQPNAIAAAWERGDIDAAFVWDPALGRIKDTGKVLITSGQLCQWGKCTFDGMLVNKKWGQENKDFMAKFVKIIADTDESYRSNMAAWTPDSPMVKKIVGLVGGEAKDVPGVLALYGFPSLKEQASPAWLGGGANGGAARALKFTAEFLQNEKKIDKVQLDYGKFVNSTYVEAAMKLK
jgi:taurine transport system substrate-binding protein